MRELITAPFWQAQLASPGGELLAKATLLLVAALALSLLLRSAAAGVRHLLWACTIGALLLLPLLSSVSPVRMEVLPTALASAPRPVAASGDRGLIEGDAAVTVAPRPHAHDAAVHDPGVAPAPVVVAEAGVSSPSARVSLPLLLALAWGIVALGLFARLGVGWLLVRRIAATGEELTSPDWTTPLWEAADRLDLPDVPRLVRSERAALPFACGIRRPMIVLPPEAEEWGAERRRAVLFHELAHVRRRDLLAHTLGRIACALYWPHPLVWSAARRLRAESERACDDLVLATGTRASEYADHLLQIVTGARHSRAPAVALPMAQRREFEGRMLAILDPRGRRRFPRAQAAMVSATVLMIALVLAASAPVSADAPSLVAADDLPYAGEAEAARPMRVPESAEPRSGTAGAPLAALEAPSVKAVADTDLVSAATGIAGVATDIALVTTEATLEALRQLGFPVPVAEAMAEARAEIRAELKREALAMPAERSRDHSQSEARSRSRPGSTTAKAPEDPERHARETALLVNVLGSSSDPIARRTAAWGLHRRTTTEASVALRQALRGDADEGVRETAAWALSTRMDRASFEALAAAATGDRSAQVRETAIWALGHHRAREYASNLAPAFAHPSGDVRLVAAWAIGQMRPSSAPPQLIAALDDPRADVQEAAAWAIGEIRDPAAVPALLRALDGAPRKGAREAIVRAVVLTSAADHEMLERLARSGHADLSERALRSIARGGADTWPWPWPWPRPRPAP